MTACGATARGGRALERYWSIVDGDVVDVEEVVAQVFSPGAVYASAELPTPRRGQRDIARHLRQVRRAGLRSTTRHVTDVQWVHDTARWCWRSTGPGGVSRRGMDVVRMAPDGERIELLVVFDGLLPAPA